MRYALTCLMLCTAAVLGGCATLFTGTTDKLSVSSTPIAAKITITPKYGKAPVFLGQTPATVELKRSDEYTVLVEAPGYEPAKTQIGQDFNGWTLLDILWGPLMLVAGAIDVVTGSFWYLERDHLAVALVGAQPGAPAAAPSTQPPPTTMPVPPPPSTMPPTPPPNAPSTQSVPGPAPAAPPDDELPPPPPPP